ncbi:MAG: signal peptidase I [candidate division Zixibacteria bacterium]|nr:signal peptidase I [candidate division Zixibacteria bacterium]
MSGRSDSRKSRPSPGGALWDNTKQFLIAIVLALMIKTSVVEAYKIPSSSMEDTLLVGDFLLANKFVYGARIWLTNLRLPAIHDPRRGDVVIFIFPGDGVTKYIKRCVAVGGDTIEVRDTVVFINGQPQPRPAKGKFGGDNEGIHLTKVRQADQRDTRDFFGPYVVPPDHYFMMGDNRDNSYDSRYWGPVSRDAILGEAMAVHWSWYEPAKDDSTYAKLGSPEVSISDPLSVPRLFWFNVVHFLEKVRWERLFRPIT